ncbi:MAG: phosphatase PAP2 family protein [Patescibacteria group bacterium]|nr:phosphatase PAP2 family protein [Patescibacteria group bacterium]
MKDYNKIFFDKINSWQGKNRWLDAFGRAGAEWVVIVMVAWLMASVFVVYAPDWSAVWWLIFTLSIAWLVGWLADIGIGLFVREPRPQVNEPQIKQLFTPFSYWKSFPSDHAMTAFLIFFLMLALGLPGAWAMFILAFWVAFGRLYAGVHYPIDILGGLTVAAGVAVWTRLILFLL